MNTNMPLAHLGGYWSYHFIEETELAKLLVEPLTTVLHTGFKQLHACIIVMYIYWKTGIFQYKSNRNDFEDLLCLWGYNYIHYICNWKGTSAFVGSCLATKVFYRQFAGYGKGVGHHKVGQWWMRVTSTINKSVNWDTLDHASHASQLMSCNYILHVCVWLFILSTYLHMYIWCVYNNNTVVWSFSW